MKSKLNFLKSKKWRWVIGIIMVPVLLVAAWVVFPQYFLVLFLRPQNNLHAWQPTQLPPGLKITKQHYNLRVNPALETFTYQYSFDFNKPGFSLYENAHNEGYPGTTPCYGWGGDTDCKEYVAKNGLHYNVVISSYNSKPFDLTVEGNDDTTDFYFSVPQSEVPNYIHYDWSQMMDSLQPINISNKHPVILREHCCGG